MDLAKKGFETMLDDPAAIKDTFLDLAGDKLAYRAGSVYTQATRWCLTCDTRVGMEVWLLMKNYYRRA
jgi:hypothetical protein